MAHAIAGDGGSLLPAAHARRHAHLNCHPHLLLAGAIGGPSAQTAQAALVLLMHVGFSFFLLLAWYGGLSGNFFSWRALIVASALVAVVLNGLHLGFGRIVAQRRRVWLYTRRLFAGPLMGFWLIIVLGVHFLARQTLAHSDWQDLDELTRGQQVDFALAIMKTPGPCRKQQPLDVWPGHCPASGCETYLSRCRSSNA